MEEFEEYPKWIAEESDPNKGVIVLSKEEEDALKGVAPKAKKKSTDE